MFAFPRLSMQLQLLDSFRFMCPSLSQHVLDAEDEAVAAASPPNSSSTLLPLSEPTLLRKTACQSLECEGRKDIDKCDTSYRSRFAGGTPRHLVECKRRDGYVDGQTLTIRMCSNSRYLEGSLICCPSCNSEISGFREAGLVTMSVVLEAKMPFITASSLNNSIGVESHNGKIALRDLSRWLASGGALAHVMGHAGKFLKRSAQRYQSQIACQGRQDSGEYQTKEGASIVTSRGTAQDLSVQRNATEHNHPTYASTSVIPLCQQVLPPIKDKSNFWNGREKLREVSVKRSPFVDMPLRSSERPQLYSKLGSGGFGQVHRAHFRGSIVSQNALRTLDSQRPCAHLTLRKPTNHLCLCFRKVAVKTIRWKEPSTTRALYARMTALNERSLLKSMKHPHIIELIDYSIRLDMQQVQLFLPYCSGGSLRSWIEDTASGHPD
ncbi:hypothetical protein U1Q18_044830 [Sarracenia purpurea var. burkii]